MAAPCGRGPSGGGLCARLPVGAATVRLRSPIPAHGALPAHAAAALPPTAAGLPPQLFRDGLLCGACVRVWCVDAACEDALGERHGGGCTGAVVQSGSGWRRHGCLGHGGRPPGMPTPGSWLGPPPTAPLPPLRFPHPRTPSAQCHLHRGGQLCGLPGCDRRITRAPAACRPISRRRRQRSGRGRMRALRRLQPPAAACSCSHPLPLDACLLPACAAGSLLGPLY